MLTRNQASTSDSRPGVAELYNSCKALVRGTTAGLADLDRAYEASGQNVTAYERVLCVVWVLLWRVKVDCHITVILSNILADVSKELDE